MGSAGSRGRPPPRPRDRAVPVLHRACSRITFDLSKYSGQVAGVAEVPVRLVKSEGVRWVEFQVVNRTGQRQQPPPRTASRSGERRVVAVPAMVCASPRPWTCCSG
ncbi:MAG: hypothetical protein MZV64_16955 [Ignavibacteriales bacterium]|nr:hypothetical protein [Ignavibacteriales bacterium]